MVELVTGGLGYVGSVYVACAASRASLCRWSIVMRAKKICCESCRQSRSSLLTCYNVSNSMEIVAEHKPQVVHHFAAHSAVGIVPRYGVCR